MTIKRILFSLLFLVVAGWCGLFVFGMVQAIQEARKDYPGKAGFNVADEKISLYKSPGTFGNSAEAEEMATEFSQLMQTAQRELFTGGSKLNVATAGHFLTYCQADSTQVVFLCHVPDLRGYKKEVREALADLAWTLAQNIAQEHKRPKSVKLAVGLRGFTAYGPVWEGAVDGLPKEKSDGVLEKVRLYPYFAELAPVALPAAK